MALYFGHFDFSQKLLGSVPDLYSPAECARILDGVTGATWLPATVNRREGRVVDKSLRDSATAVVDDPRLATELYERILPHVPARMVVEDPSLGPGTAMRVSGIFLPLRIYRYEPGQQFGLHQDQGYSGPDGSRSLLTLMLYLNDDFDGGETDFPEQETRVVPRTGSALWFQHMLLHSGARVTRGIKYVLRSDVLYRAEALG
jgi:predicted 2-oxoglutarate/Fe(II)-dependent dioxygenase YbiX